MEWLKSLYPEVWNILQKAVPEYWHQLKQINETLIGDQLIPEAALPLASCKSVGGDPKQALYISAALIAAATSLRILDDLEDRDRPKKLWNQVGTARAWNYAAAYQSVSFDLINRSPLKIEKKQQIIAAFSDMYLHMTYGQDRDIIGITRSVEDYWATVAEKIAYGYATGCGVGAVIGTENIDLINACRDFGFHLGYVIQIVNDMESVWSQNGISDLKQNKVTLPIIYALTTKHPQRDALISLVKSSKIASGAAAIKDILDSIDTKNFLTWAALKERDQALQALNKCPDSDGRQALEAYVTGVFGDIDTMLPHNKSAQ
jgi:geranylgeranyl diphosphate synthase type I